jgi:DNA-binding CsgD family transcriptional regulator
MTARPNPDRQRPERRAALPEVERRQLLRLAAGLGPIAAARALGITVNTFQAALSGAAINPSTRATMLNSGWLLSEESTAL